MKRRWTLKLTDRDGTEHVMTVEVPAKSDGTVYVRAGDGRAYRLDPKTVSRMREIYADALSVALQDRGEW